MRAADLASPETCEHLDCVMTEEGLKTRGERWDWQHKALLMGTQCASTPRQTALSSWRERQSGREWERESCKVGGLLSSHFVYRLPVASTHTHELTDTHTHTPNTRVALAHRHAETQRSEGSGTHIYTHAQHG